MNTVLLLLSLVFLIIEIAKAHKKGPPVDSTPNLCMDMFPTGHGAQAQTSTSPYKIITSNKCYKKGQKIGGNCACFKS